MNKIDPPRFSDPITMVMALCFSVLMSGPVKADSVLQAYVNQLKTFNASFEQMQPDEARFQTNEAKGFFKLQRPGKLEWIYTEPDSQRIVVDGTNLWVQDDDLEQVTVRPVDDIKADIPLSWLLYDEPIESRFTIIKSGHQQGIQWFNLTPKQATYFQSIDIGMVNGQMKEVWMYQGPENITKVRFNLIKENEPIDDSAFLMSVPPNYDLVGQAQP